VWAFAAYPVQHAVSGTALRLASRLHPASVDGEIFVQDGDRIPGVPAHSGKAGVSVKLTGRLDIAADLQARTSQFLRSDEANLLPPVPGFAVMNVRGSYRLTNRLAAVADAHNLFDRRFYTFGVLGDPALLETGGDDARFYSPGAPRAFRAGVEVRF
jgi:outer membrane receptor protein involved in Fe transport